MSAAEIKQALREASFAMTENLSDSARGLDVEELLGSVSALLALETLLREWDGIEAYVEAVLD